MGIGATPMYPTDYAKHIANVAKRYKQGDLSVEMDVRKLLRHLEVLAVVMELEPFTQSEAPEGGDSASCSAQVFSAPGDQQNCCLILDNNTQCPNPAEWTLYSPDNPYDYTHTCTQHVGTMLEPHGATVHPFEQNPSTQSGVL